MCRDLIEKFVKAQHVKQMRSYFVADFNHMEPLCAARTEKGRRKSPEMLGLLLEFDPVQLWFRCRCINSKTFFVSVPSKVSMYTNL